MRKKDVFVLSTIVVLAGLLFFMSFRSTGSVTGAAIYCADCEDASDCDDKCLKECRGKAYDWAEAKAEVSADGTIKCSCECSGYIKGLLD